MLGEKAQQRSLICWYTSLWIINNNLINWSWQFILLPNVAQLLQYEMVDYQVKILQYYSLTMKWSHTPRSMQTNGNGITLQFTCDHMGFVTGQGLNWFHVLIHVFIFSIPGTLPENVGDHQYLISWHPAGYHRLHSWSGGWFWTCASCWGAEVGNKKVSCVTMLFPGFSLVNARWRNLPADEEVITRWISPLISGPK